MDGSAASDRTEKPWDHPWTTDEMRDKRADWNLAGDSGLLQHLEQFSDKLMTTANKTQEALNSLTSELDETIIFIDNITNTSLALANTQFIESRVCEDDIEPELPQESQLEPPKTKEQLDAELIASIGESVRRGIAIMEDKYETLEVVASDSEDEGDIQIPSVILRPKDPYQDRPLPYVIGSDKWKNSSKIGLETSSSESEHQEDDDSEDDSDNNIMPPVSKPINLQNPRIARLSSSSSESNDYNEASNIPRHTDDSGSNKNQDIFDSESEATTAANSLPKNSTSAAPNFAEELAKRLGSVIPTQKSINTQVIGEPVSIQPEVTDDLFTPEDDDLFGAPSKNLFNEPVGGLFDEESSNSLWHDKPAKTFNKSTFIPPSLDVPPPINDVSTKPKSAIDDLFGDGDSEDSDDIFSGKSSASKPFSNQNNSPSNNLRTEENKRSKNLLSVGALIGKEGMTTSTPETNDAANSIFDNESEDVENLFNQRKKTNDWTGAKASIPEKTAGSTPAEASGTNNRKKPVGGVSILGQIDIFASGKLRRQASSDSSSSKSSSSDFDASTSRITNTGDGSNSVRNNHNNSADGNSVVADRNMEITGSSGISLQPPSIDDVTTGSNISPGFQPQMTSTWNKTGDMYRERIGSDSLFAAKTLDGDNGNSLNNARVEVPEVQDSEPLEDTNDIFGPPPLPKTGSKTSGKSKVASLFDDSDSGEDIFSNASSGSRSLKSADLLTTTTISAAHSLSSDKSKVIRNKGLFDDDDDDESDIFGSKDSSEVNLFDSKTSAKNQQSKIVQEASVISVKEDRSKEVVSSSVQQEGLESSFEKQNTVKISQTAPITKLGSIFDDLDDDDLFSPSFGKKTSSGKSKPVAPSLFDDKADDLFAAASAKTTATVGKDEKTAESSSFEKSVEVSESAHVKSSTKIGGERKSKVMEQLAAKLDVQAKKEEKGDAETKSKNESTAIRKSEKTVKNVEENTAASKSVKNDDFSKNKSKILASKIFDEIKTVQKSKMDGEAKPGIAKKPEVFKKLHRKLDVVSKSDHSEDTVSSNVRSETRSENVEETQVVSEESSVTSFGSDTRISSSESDRSSRISKTESLATDHEISSKSSKSEESLTAARREPPKTLEIRSSTTSVSSEKSSAVQRRVVSGKIKNLMGCMSDLKILSPTDTPPVWRKNEERVDEEGDKDSEDGSGFSTSKESPTLSEELPKIVAIPSPIDRKELEPAISFDQPVQVETLSVTASKSRVRIQTKRRPQSRHARQNALRKSGIDFDTIDFSNDNNSDTNRNLSSNSANNNPTSTENSANAQNIANSNTDRLIIPTGGGSDSVTVKVTESSSSTFFDDRSEISFSKESSLSINKNTLLSPSTDEEDLFDVPPDLPEDPPKEDSLFGRAPILSPVESFVKVQKNAKHESHRTEKRKDGVTEETTVSQSQSKISSTIATKESSRTDTKNVFHTGSSTDDVSNKTTSEKKESVSDRVSKEESKPDQSLEQNTSGSESKTKNRVVRTEKGSEGLSDPLRDSSLDPLKDPSNLFAFVTKTPSPEKGKNLLFNEDDDSLFSSSLSKSSKNGKAGETGGGKTGLGSQKKQTLDLFADDSEVDFFTAALPKSTRKSQKDSKIDLFADDDNQDDDLFGGSKTKTLVKSSQSVKTEKTEINEVVETSSRKHSLFADSSEEKLFGSSTTTEAKSDNKKAASFSSGLFSDDDGSAIFSGGKAKSKSNEVRSSGAKKIVNDIFGDQSSGEEDMFAAKKTVIKKSTVSSGLFGDDNDDDDGENGGNIFGKSTSVVSVTQSKSIENRGVVKKAATRDLRKTAEKIVEDDPLSLLQRD